MIDPAFDERVIVLAPVGNDASAMAAMLEQNGLPVAVGRDGHHARQLLEQGAGVLLATEEALQLPQIDVAIAFIGEQPPWSELPMIILTSGGPGRTAQLLELTDTRAGSITVLERPLEAELLVRTVRVALNARRRQYQVRDLLEEQRRRRVELEEAKQAADRELDWRRQAEAALTAWIEEPAEFEPRSRLARHALAALVMMVAIAVRAAFDPVIGDGFPFSTLFGAIAVIVWLAGMWPAIWTAVVGYVAFDWLFAPPRHVFTHTLADAYGLALAAVAVSLIVAIGVRMRRAQGRARAAARLAMERQRHAERALDARDRAELKARESDERLRVAIKSSRFVLAECDREGRYRWIYDPHGAFGPLGNVIGRRDDEFDDSEAGRRLLELKLRVIDSGRGTAADLTFAGADGLRTYAFTIEPWRDAAGSVAGATTAALDITDRKRAEDALRASEERARQQFAELDAIYHGAPLGLAVLDTELRFRRINDRMAQLNGVPADDHIGRSVAELLPSLEQQAREALRQVLETGRPMRFEFKGETTVDPGVERIWDEHWYPLRDGRGTIAGIAVMAEDVTERRRNEQALRENEELFRALAENVPQLAWMGRADGSMFWYNRRWFDYTGTTLAQMQGWGWQRVHHPDYVERVTAGFRRAISKGIPWEDTFPLRAADGHYRWFLSRAFPIHDANGRITRWFGTNTDITVLRKTEDALREAQQQIRQYAAKLEKTVAERTAKLQETVQELEAFSYSIAHDMRAPLRSMIGYAEIVREEHAAGVDEVGHDYLRRITVSARRLDRLIQDVLNYSRIVREEMPLEAVDIRQLILEVIDSYPNLAAAREHIAIDPALPLVRGNRAALTQVVSNLLENAVKFVPAGATPAVRIRTDRIGADPHATERVRIWIEDNGIGIEPSVRPRLFQMFQRFTRPGLYEGTGIGLAIVRKAVDRMGGTIGVESEVGKGSRFWFVLPPPDQPEHDPEPRP